MALTIDNPEADRLAGELAARTGESVENAVLKALREQIAQQEKLELKRFPTDEENARQTRAAIREIQERIANLPVLDDRPPDELLGYDEWGLPH